MSIYIFSTAYISEKLMPPSLRGAKHLAWLKVLLSPIQTLWKYLFVDFADGSNYAAFDSIVNYTRGDRVVHSNRKVYECISTPAPALNPLPTNTIYWVKINDNFIGARERLKYNSQKILFEYTLNKWFFVPATDPQIYIINNIVNGNQFFLGASSETSSKLAATSIFQTAYLGNDYTPNQYDFTIYVPVLVFNAQGTTPANREQAIRDFADLYTLAGMQYQVTTY